MPETMSNGTALRERLTSVRLVRPRVLELIFEDHFKADLDVDLLEMPTDRIRWESAALSSGGTAMLVTAVEGEAISIDASTLRCLVDAAFATEVRRSLDALKPSRDELRQLAKETRQPSGFQTGTPDDLTLDSWK
jgi:hypothetical protein